MGTAVRSLRELHPRRWDIPCCVAATAALLMVSLNLPVLYVEKLIFWDDEYSIMDGVVNLAKEGDYVLSFIIFVFSVVFPFAKLTGLLVLWFRRFREDARRGVLEWLEALGKWSMLDVFVVAIIIVVSKTGSMLDAAPRIGLYLFIAAVLASMAMTKYMTRLARNARRDGRRSGT